MRFSDERYVEYQLQRCNADQRTFNEPLTVLSVVTSALVLLVRVRHEAYRKFPDNAFAAALCTLCGLHGTMLISAVTRRKVVLLHTHPWPTVCKVQATLIHWFTCAAVWTVIAVMVAIYLIVVRHVSAQSLAKRTRLFYASLVLVPSTAVAACWRFGGYGPFPGLDTCWINPGVDRLLYFHTFTILGVVISLSLGPVTGYSLWRAYRGALDHATYARVFRSMLIRHVLLACYGFVMSVAFLLGGANTLYLKIDTHAHTTWYIKRTAYTYCMVSAVNFATLGLFVSLIFFSTKSRGRAVRAAVKRVWRAAARSWLARRHALERQSAMALPSRLLHTRSKREISLAATRESKPMTSPRSPGGRLLFPSAFDSDGQTALSIPPDPRARRAQQQAASAYTSTLLEYAREQLLEESVVLDDSDFESTSGSFSSCCNSVTSNGNSFGSFGSVRQQHQLQPQEPLDDLVFATEIEIEIESTQFVSPRVTPYHQHCDIDDGDDAHSVFVATGRRHTSVQRDTIASAAHRSANGITTEL